jgi:AraC family transcriptional activator of mtrCDE
MITLCPNTSYQSRSSFTRKFRGYYGSDPSEYRASAQRASSDSATPTEDTIEESDAA